MNCYDNFQPQSTCCVSNYPVQPTNNYAIILVLFILLVIILGTRFSN